MKELSDEYLTSLFATKRIQMMTAKRISALLFLARGWRGTAYGTFYPPAKFKTYASALTRRGDRGVSIIRYNSILQDWRGVGAVRTEHGVNCSLSKSFVLTSTGMEIFTRCSPELLTEARAIFRATLWEQIRWQRDYNKSVVPIRRKKAK